MSQNQAESETMEGVLKRILSIKKEDVSYWNNNEVYKQNLSNLRTSIMKLPIAERIICASIYNNKFINPTNDKEKELKFTLTETHDTLVGYNTVTRKIKESYTRALNCLCDDFSKKDKVSCENFFKIDGQLNQELRDTHIQSLNDSSTGNVFLFNKPSVLSELNKNPHVKALRTLKDLNVDEFLQYDEKNRNLKYNWSSCNIFAWIYALFRGLQKIEKTALKELYHKQIYHIGLGWYLPTNENTVDDSNSFRPK